MKLKVKPLENLKSNPVEKKQKNQVDISLSQDS